MVRAVPVAQLDALIPVAVEHIRRLGARADKPVDFMPFAVVNAFELAFVTAYRMRFPHGSKTNPDASVVNPSVTAGTNPL